ncbi:MAG: hypothetical protein P1V35_08660, partial [Planctomycetota bacterium]|nr:hypothetical protein [Planctomycetota bacterium]
MEDRINQPDSGAEGKRSVLMRGLTGSEKSCTAKRMAERDQGVLLELDSFFEDNTTGRGEVKLVWGRKALPEPRRWQMGRVCKAIDSGLSPIVVDENHRPGM